MLRLFALVVVAGCSPTSFAFTPTVPSVSPKPDNCSVDALTATPSRSYQVIGTLDYYNGPEPKTLDDLKAAVAKQVCSTGGNAVVATADDKGHYTKATVISYLGPDIPDRPGSVAPEKAPTAKAPAAKPPEQSSDSEIPK